MAMTVQIPLRVSLKVANQIEELVQEKIAARANNPMASYSKLSASKVINQILIEYFENKEK